MLQHGLGTTQPRDWKVPWNFPFDGLLPPKPNTRITTSEDRRQSRLIFGEQRFFVHDIRFPFTFPVLFLPPVFFYPIYLETPTLART